MIYPYEKLRFYNWLYCKTCGGIFGTHVFMHGQLNLDKMRSLWDSIPEYDKF